MNNLGALYQDQGNLEAAEPLYRRAFLSREAQLGGEHPKTLSSMYNLATLLEAKGQLQEAEDAWTWIFIIDNHYPSVIGHHKLSLIIFCLFSLVLMRRMWENNPPSNLTRHIQVQPKGV